jgi:hypothetical protein
MKSLLQTLGIVVTSTVIAGSISGEAQAYSLVPQAEGEINVGLGCLSGSCLPVDFTVTSLVDTTTGTKSRLFVDDLNTVNQYGTGVGKVKFKKGDEGTVPGGFWFRPSEVQPNGSNEEQGRLEVGTFLFEFGQTISELTIEFFDNESTAYQKNGKFFGTQVLGINGNSTAGSFIVPKGENSNIYSQSFKNVKSILIAFGQDYASGTGDGVDFQISKSTPEPVSILGFGAIAIVGLLGSKKKAIN